VAAFAFNGCTSESEATVACTGCNAEMARADASEVDGKFYCAGCAADAHGEEIAGEEMAGGEKLACAGGCGMEMAQADMKEVEGKLYCAGCAAHAGHDHAGDK